jgi:hypothetical protein
VELQQFQSFHKGGLQAFGRFGGLLAISQSLDALALLNNPLLKLVDMTERIFEVVLIVPHEMD